MILNNLSESHELFVLRFFVLLIPADVPVIEHLGTPVPQGLGAVPAVVHLLPRFVAGALVPCLTRPKHSQLNLNYRQHYS